MRFRNTERYDKTLRPLSTQIGITKTQRKGTNWNNARTKETEKRKQKERRNKRTSMEKKKKKQCKRKKKERIPLQTGATRDVLIPCCHAKTDDAIPPWFILLFYSCEHALVTFKILVSSDGKVGCIHLQKFLWSLCHPSIAKRKKMS